MTGPIPVKHEGFGLDTALMRTVLSAVFGLAFGIILISGNVRILITSDQTYAFNWWKNDVSESAALPRSALNDIGSQFRAYFTNDEPYLLLTVESGTEEIRLLNEREVLHMGDVKRLVRRIFLAEWVAGAVVLAYAGGGILWWKHAFWKELGRGIRYAAAGMAVAVVAIGGAAIIDFESTFTVFHEVSFSNDYWKLAYDDYLIQMFPEPFWFQATIALVALTGLEVAVALSAWRRLSSRLGRPRRPCGPRLKATPT